MRGHLLFLLIFSVKTQVNYTEEIDGDIEDGELEDIVEIQNLKKNIFLFELIITMLYIYTAFGF